MDLAGIIISSGVAALIYSIVSSVIDRRRIIRQLEADAVRMFGGTALAPVRRPGFFAWIRGLAGRD